MSASTGPTFAIASGVIGRNVHANANYFDGLLDDVRLYDTALDAVDIHALYTLEHNAHEAQAPAPPTLVC